MFEERSGVEQPLGSKKDIAALRRETLSSNLQVLGISLPKTIRLRRKTIPLIDEERELTDQAVKIIWQITPDLVTNKIVSENIIGFPMFLPGIEKLLEKIEGCSIVDPHLKAKLAALKQKREELAERQPVSPPPEEALSKPHFKIPEYLLKDIPELTEREKLDRLKQTETFLGSYRGEAGTIIHLVGDWLVGKFNEILGQPIYLFDLIQPPESAENRDHIFFGTYVLSENLGLENKLGMTLNSIIRNVQRIEDLDLEIFIPLFAQIKNYLARFDNPEDIVFTAIKAVRQKTIKYFVPKS